MGYSEGTIQLLCPVHRCLEYLLRNDANPEIRDNQGYNAVHYASAYGHRLCLELVRALTPPPSVSDRCDRSDH